MTKHPGDADPTHAQIILDLLGVTAEPDNCPACVALSDAIEARIRATQRVRAAGRRVDRAHGLNVEPERPRKRTP